MVQVPIETRGQKRVRQIVSRLAREVPTPPEATSPREGLSFGKPQPPSQLFTTPKTAAVAGQVSQGELSSRGRPSTVTAQPQRILSEEDRSLLKQENQHRALEEVRARFTRTQQRGPSFEAQRARALQKGQFTPEQQARREEVRKAQEGQDPVQHPFFKGAELFQQAILSPVQLFPAAVFLALDDAGIGNPSATRIKELQAEGLSFFEASRQRYDEATPKWKKLADEVGLNLASLAVPVVGVSGATGAQASLRGAAASLRARTASQAFIARAVELQAQGLRGAELEEALLATTKITRSERAIRAGATALEATGEALTPAVAAEQFAGEVLAVPFQAGAAAVRKGAQLSSEAATRLRPSLQKLATGERGAVIPPRISKVVAPPPETVGNTFLAPVRPLEDVIGEVVTSDNPAIRTLTRGTNPAVRKSTDVGKAVTAFQRQLIAADSLTQTAVSAALDVHAERITGRLGKVLPIDSDGVLQGTGKLWQDVFSQPGAFKLAPTTRAYVKDFLKVVDEVKGLRVAAGLAPRATPRGEGLFYVPRQVKGIRGVELQRPSSPKLQRLYEEASDGFARGVRYDTDPRATLELHVRSAYREIAEKQLADVLEPLSITPKQLVREPVRIRLEQAIQSRKVAERALREAKFAEQRWLKNHADELPGVLSVGKQRNLNKLQQAIKARRSELDGVLTKYQSAKKSYSKAIEAARRAEVAPGSLFGRTEDTIAIGNWRNRFYTREQADQIKESIGLFGRSEARQSPMFRGIELVGNHIRFLSAVGDFAAPFIQGLPVLATNPKQWGKASWAHYQAWVDPGVQARFIKDHLTTMQKMAQHGVPIGDPEFFAALRQGQGLSPGQLLEFLPKGPEARALFQQAGRQTFGRFQASYNNFLTNARVLMWESMETTARFRNNPSELARTVRNMTGGLDSRALGVGPNQRAVEGIWLAFSPRLLRSTIAMTNDAIGGFVRLASLKTPSPAQAQALQTMAQLAAGATGIYIATGVALGKSEKEIREGLNPLNGKRFLSHNINGDWIGIGGQVRAITQVIGKLGSTLGPGGEPIGDILKVDQFENPLIALYMSRGAPGINLVGGTAEFALDKDILPFENIDTAPDLLKHFGTSALPFALQGRLEGENVSTTMLALGGLRTSPQTEAEARDFARAKVLQGLDIQMESSPGTLAFKEEFRALGADVQRQVNNDPSVQQAQQDVAEGQREQNSDYQAYKDERQGIDDKYDNLIGQAALELGPSRGFRDALAVHQRDRARDKEGLEGRSQDALSFIQELEPSTAEFDIALNDYLGQLDDPVLENPATLEYDFQERNQRIEALTQQYGSDMIARIEDFLHETEHPMAARLRADRKILEPYWAITDNLGLSPIVERVWQEYLDAPPAKQQAMLLQFGELQDAIKLRSEFRKVLREARPDIDVALVRWGYLSSNSFPVTVEGWAELNRQPSQPPISTPSPVQPTVLEQTQRRVRQVVGR